MSYIAEENAEIHTYRMNDSEIPPASTSNLEIVPCHTETPSPSRNRASKTNEYFRKTEKGNYVCKLCKEGIQSKEVIILKDKNGCTASRWRHLKKYHRSVHNTLRGVLGHQEHAKDLTEKFGYAGQNEEFSGEELVRFILGTDGVFSLADSHALKRLLSHFSQDGITLPSVSTVQRATNKIYEEGGDKLKRTLGSVPRVSLTADVWNSDDEILVLRVMVYWINGGWILCKHVLAMRELAFPYTGNIIAETLLRVVKDFNLVDKVCAVTTHNVGGGFNAIIKYLEEAAKKSHVSFMPAHHVPCIEHVINIAVREGLQLLGVEPAPTEAELSNQILESSNGTTMREDKDNIVFGALLSRLRKAIISIKMSPLRRTQYRIMCEDLGIEGDNKLSVDSSRSWNSTLDMLCAAVSRRPVLDKMAKDILDASKQDYSFTKKEWDLLEIFAHLLWPFRDGVEILRSSKCLHLSRIMPIVEGLLQLLKENMASLDREVNAPESSLTTKESTLLKCAYEAMLLNLTKYQDILKQNPSYTLATVLDPQIKLTTTLPTKHQAIRDQLLLLLENVGRSRNHEVLVDSTWERETTPSRIGSVSRLPNRLSMILSGLEPVAKQARVTDRNEIKEYLDEACAVGDPLTWWGQVGCFRYPKLARLAKEYLSIRVTSAPSGENSVIGRDSLKGEAISVLMTLKCWAREEGQEDLGLGGENEKPKGVET